MTDKKYAVVDFGTNSARIMLAQIKHGKVVPLSKKLNTIRLGEKMTDGKITKSAMLRAKDALNAFKAIANKQNVDVFYAFATAAVRQAANKQEFIDYLQKNCSITVDVISGNDEAKIGYKGATAGKDGCIGVIDIGGGSTEVVLGTNGNITYAHSFKTGTVSLLQNHFAANPTNTIEYARCADQIKLTLSTLPKNIETTHWVGIGGTATALAAVAQDLKVYDPKKVDGYRLNLASLTALSSTLQTQTLNERKALTALDEKRADVIVFGALIMQTFLQTVNATGYTACESDNLEGYLIEKLSL